MIYILCILCLSNTAILHTFDCMVEYMVQYVDHWFTVTHYSGVQWFTVLCIYEQAYNTIHRYNDIQDDIEFYAHTAIQLNTMTHNDLHWYKKHIHSDTNKHIQSDTRRNWYAMRWVASIQRKPLPGLILHSAFFFFIIVIVIIFNTTVIITINSSFTLFTAILADNYGFK